MPWPDWIEAQLAKSTIKIKVRKDKSAAGRNLQLYADEVYELMRVAYAGILIRVLGTWLLQHVHPREIPLYGIRYLAVNLGINLLHILGVEYDAEHEELCEYLKANPVINKFEEQFPKEYLFGISGERPSHCLNDLEAQLMSRSDLDQEKFAIAKAAADELQSSELIKKLHKQYYEQVHLSNLEDL